MSASEMAVPVDTFAAAREMAGDLRDRADEIEANRRLPNHPSSELIPSKRRSVR